MLSPSTPTKSSTATPPLTPPPTVKRKRVRATPKRESSAEHVVDRKEAQVEKVGESSTSQPDKRVRPKRSKKARVTDLVAEIVDEGVSKPWLIQERVRHDTWKLLVATSLLNVTTGKAAIPLFWKLLERWPNPQVLSEANVDELRDLIHRLGLSNVRSARLILLSKQYLQSPFHASSSDHVFTAESVRQFAGAGQYAVDSFTIYSPLLRGGGAPRREEEERNGRESAREEGDDAEAAWRTCRPRDKELIRYLIWRWSTEGIIYDPIKGPLAIKVEEDEGRPEGPAAVAVTLKIAKPEPTVKQEDTEVPGLRRSKRRRICISSNTLTFTKAEPQEIMGEGISRRDLEFYELFR